MLEKHRSTPVPLCAKLMLIIHKMFTLLEESVFYYMCYGSISFSHAITEKQKLRYTLFLCTWSRCSNFTDMITCSMSGDVCSQLQKVEF